MNVLNFIEYFIRTEYLIGLEVCHDIVRTIHYLFVHRNLHFSPFDDLSTVDVNYQTRSNERKIIQKVICSALSSEESIDQSVSQSVNHLDVHPLEKGHLENLYQYVLLIKQFSVS